MPAVEKLIQEEAVVVAKSTGESASLWEVVGGGDKGGIIVRESEKLCSREVGRLSRGALVRTLELCFVGGRLRYELVSGAGPASGWVSLGSSGKELLVPASCETPCTEISAKTAADPVNQKGELALREYSQRFKSYECRSFPMFKRRPFPWHASSGGAKEHLQKSAEEVRMELELEMGMESSISQQVSKDGKTGGNSKWNELIEDNDLNIEPSSCHPAGEYQEWDNVSEKAWAQDSDNEEIWLCAQCGLALGDICYPIDDSGWEHVHGECMAQRMLTDLRKKENARRNKEADLKRSRRAEFDIGWNVARISKNLSVAETMGCLFAPMGMVCLALREETGTVDIVPTLEPAGSVNLEYLSIALKVRRMEGREPFFSLDPLDPEKVNSMQVKRFEPEWLVGSCVGDVLFQADYYLKELSMGEYEQPVVGMKSCFDLTWEEDQEKHWRAREWFVVRKAEMQLSDDNVLIPYVRMGVEAWEQSVDARGELQDAKVTRSDHPLLRYAQSFTHYFDLIAERKSVIYHLRDLAKASVLAKYLVDANMDLPRSWFDVVIVDPPPSVGDIRTDKSLQIPQLWNERHYGKISVNAGTIAKYDYEDGIETDAFTLYGGVQFGLDRFRVAAPQRVSRTMLVGIRERPAHVPQMFSVRRPWVPPPPKALADPQLTAVVTRAQVQALPAMPSRGAWAPAWEPDTQMRAAPARTRRAWRPEPQARADPRGVDLNLDNFDLSTATRLASQASMAQIGEDACAAIGKDFWANVDINNGSVFDVEDKSLLAKLFNPHLCDRREEADKFVPPDTSITYLETLSSLMREEESMRSQRARQFFSKEFEVDDPGPLFPSSWKDFMEIERSEVSKDGVLHPRPDYMAQTHMFDHVLRSAVPFFEKATEEGVKFRMYQVGSIELRTTQEPDSEEIVGAVFSRRSLAQAPNQGKAGDKILGQVDEYEKVARVTMYVEKDVRFPTDYRYYLVIETESAHTIMTEKLCDGSVIWKENPADLEDRNSMARAFRSKDCCGKGMTVQTLKAYYSKAADRSKTTILNSKGKRYAQAGFDKARGVATGAMAGPQYAELLKKFYTSPAAWGTSLVGYGWGTQSVAHW